MFENLSERLDRSFKLLKGEGKITEINVAETLKDVRKALLDADVNYKVAKGFTDTVKAKALGQNVLTSVKPSQLMVKIVHDELADACVELTPYGVQVRYPSHMELDESDMNCALRECRKIREFVLQRLDPHISQDIKAVTEAKRKFEQHMG